VVCGQQLFVRTATYPDLAPGMAAASDPDAQRWLGWTRESVVPETERGRLLDMRPRKGTPADTGDVAFFSAFDLASRRIAGMVGIEFRPTKQRYEVGGWLAPDFRGRGLGSELFRLALWIGHEHLGIATLYAGAEGANRPSCRALTAAGFHLIQTGIPHVLPDGRVIRGFWFQHTVEEAHRCRKGHFRAWFMAH
jgi:RimJ/RimL family protein N-acetyltransferase